MSDMSQELGRIEKPSAEGFRAGRKLLFIPLVFAPKQSPSDLAEKVQRYWKEVAGQVDNLEMKLGSVSRVYHEMVPAGGEAGMSAIQEFNEGSYQVVKSRIEHGAELHPVEDAELLAEAMDWGKCLAAGLQSQAAFTRVFEFYSEVQKKREEHVARQIDDTLKDGEMGILLFREGHGVQFPTDIQVFYVAPPALEDIKRWIRDREAQPQSGDGES